MNLLFRSPWERRCRTWNLLAARSRVPRWSGWRVKHQQRSHPGRKFVSETRGPLFERPPSIAKRRDVLPRSSHLFGGNSTAKGSVAAYFLSTTAVYCFFSYPEYTVISRCMSQNNCKLVSSPSFHMLWNAHLTMPTASPPVPTQNQHPQSGSLTRVESII